MGIHKNKKSARRAQKASLIPHLTLPIEDESRRILDSAAQIKSEMAAYYPKLLEEDLSSDASGKAASLKRTASNLSKASTQIYAVQDELSARLSDIRKQRKNRLLISAPANATIDQREKQLDHFASGMNAYKLMLIGFAGSFVGVIIEMIWCLVTNGYLESRAGLIYGPFNILYGFGAIFLTAALYKFRNRGSWISMLGGFIVGSVVEYVCSWGQEFVFGSRSWDYSQMPFNINGRICLLYSIFWGFLGVLWIKNLYPRISKYILKIPNRIGKIITWILMAFFAVDILMSGITLARWTQRQADVPPSNAFWETIDEHFPDERMERVYANMVFPE